MPWACIRCESINIDSDDTCEVCDERRGLNLPQQRQSIAAGAYHSLAITSKGTVIGWGNNKHGQITIPANVDNVVAVAAGSFSSLALCTNGKVIEWGFSWQSDTSHTTVNNIVAIAAGSFHSLALRADGTVVAWGNNDEGQCDVPMTLSSVIAIAAGANHSLALRADGTIVAWGDNSDGECNVPDHLKDVIAIAAGLGYSYALTNTGKLVTWGIQEESLNIPIVTNIAANAFHFLAITKDSHIITSDKEISFHSLLKIELYSKGKNITTRVEVHATPDGLHDVVEIAAGESHFLVRQSDGSVIAWGNNKYQQCNIPHIFHDVSLVKSIACTSTHSIAVTNLGQVVAGNTNLLAYDHLSRVQQVAIGATYALALCSDEIVYAWQHSSDKKILQQFPIPDVVAIAAGGEQYYALTSKGLVISVTFHTSKPHTIKQVPHLQHIRAIAVSSRHALALKLDGTVVAWGNNSSNKCDVPAKLNAVVAIAAGDSHSLALKATGTVVAWGSNILGQCQTPTDLRHVTAIAAGDGFSLALKADGSVQPFGWSPEIPKELGHITAIAASGRRAMFLRDDGTVGICNRNTFYDMPLEDLGF